MLLGVACPQLAFMLSLLSQSLNVPFLDQLLCVDGQFFSNLVEECGSFAGCPFVLAATSLGLLAAARLFGILTHHPNPILAQ